MAEDNSRLKPAKEPLPSTKSPLSDKSANVEEKASLLAPVPQKNTSEKLNEDAFCDSSDGPTLECLSELGSDEDRPFEDAVYSDTVPLRKRLTYESHRPDDQSSRLAVLEYLQVEYALLESSFPEAMPTTSEMVALQNKISSLRRLVYDLESTPSGTSVLRNRLSSPSLLYSHRSTTPPSPPPRYDPEPKPSTSGIEIIRNKPPSLSRPLGASESSTPGTDVVRNKLPSPSRRSFRRSPSPPQRSIREPRPKSLASKVFRRPHSSSSRDSPVTRQGSPTTNPSSPSSHSSTESARTAPRPTSPLAVSQPSLSQSLLGSRHPLRKSPPLSSAHLTPSDLRNFGLLHSTSFLPALLCPTSQHPSDSPGPRVPYPLSKYSRAGLPSPNTSTLKPIEECQTEDSTSTDSTESTKSAESVTLRLEDLVSGPPILQSSVLSYPHSPSSVPINLSQPLDVQIPENYYTSLIQAIVETEQLKSTTKPDIENVGTRRKGGPYKNPGLVRDSHLKKRQKDSDNV